MSQPGLVIIAGPNGCGKSTLAARASKEGLLFGTTTLNPDTLTTDVPDAIRTKSLDAANLIGVERAEKAVWRSIAEHTSVSVETVLSSNKYFAPAAAAKRRGFRTRLLFITLPTVEATLGRIAARVAKGGHDVPEDKVRSRWKKSHDNLVAFADIVDDVLVWSNAGASPRLVASRDGNDARYEFDHVQ